MFIGNNGSGKTSLLESVFLLSRGKTFRHFEPKRYVHHAFDCGTVWADLGDTTLAIAKYKSDGKSLLRHNQSPIANQSALARHLPTLLIDPSGMSILEDGSANRRQLLDFLCFHCEPTFHNIWLEYNRALKQRNSLLKTAQVYSQHSYTYQSTINQINAWSQLLSEHAHNLHNIRSRVFKDWQSNFYQTIGALLPQYDKQIELTYHAGYDDARPLTQILAERLLSDIELGYTRIGIHRADISIDIQSTLDNNKTHKEQAINVLSRGEKKLLITALKLSGLPQICTHQTPVILIDDIDSELDDGACELLLKALAQLPCQVFISSLNNEIIDVLTKFFDQTEVAVFSVAKGSIHPT